VSVRRSIDLRSFDVVVRDDGKLDVTATDPDGREVSDYGLTVDETVELLRRWQLEVTE
jgi:hypothetical protein